MDLAKNGRWPPNSAHGSDHTTNMGGADVYGREQLDDDVVSSARRPLLSGVGSEAEPNPWIARIIILLWLCMTPLAIIYRKEITDFVRYIAMKGADQGPLLYVYYVLIFIFTVSICISAEIMLVSSGFIFSHLHGQIAGIAIGTGLSFIAYFITMLLCFLVSRYLLKGLVYRYLRHYKYYGALIRATEKEGLQLVTMIRLSPFFPPTIVSYIFGSTNVSVRDYCLATFAAIPSLAFFTYIGSLIEDFSNDTKPPKSSGEIAVFIGVSIVITIVGLYYTYMVTKRHLEPNRSPRRSSDAESNSP